MDFMDKKRVDFDSFPEKKEPNIYTRKLGVEYCRFGIKDLYSYLFVNKMPWSHSTLITFPSAHEKKDGKELLEFLLPTEIFNYVDRKLKSCESEEAIAKHYKDYLVKVQKDNMVARYIQFCFFDNLSKASGKNFAETFHQHFISLLSDATFTSSLTTELKKLKKYIIPEKCSQELKNAFDLLIEQNTHKSISIAIANIFASAMIGLYSIKYYAVDEDGNKIIGVYKKGPKKGQAKDEFELQCVKTYILNDLGIRYIWKPESITTSFEELFSIQNSFDHGDYVTSINNVESWIKEHEQSAPPKELAKAYQLKGLALCKLAKNKEKGFEDQLGNGIKLLEKSISTGVAEPHVYWVLYKHYEDKRVETAVEYLKTAFAQNYAKAVVEVAFMFFGEKTITKEISCDEILKRIEYIISNESENEPSDVGMCYYLRGRFARKKGAESEAQKYFEIAATKGNERAKRELIRKERNAERNSFPSFSNQPKVNCCYANTLTGNNYQVLSTFPSDEWALYAPVKTALNGIQFVHDINEFIKLQHIGKFEFCRPKILFLFMSDDKEKNLNDCLELLDKLFNAVHEIPDKQKWELIDNTYIYVSANYETASMLIDANMSQMGNDIYFKVHIADENRDTVHKLLCDAPLFIPALNGAKSEKSTSVVLFGSSELNYSFIKESIASAYSGGTHPIDITLLGENADVLESRFKQECPGIFSCLDITCIRPKFIKCSIQETDFPKLISDRSQTNPSSNKVMRRKEPDDDIAEVLKYGNYFIVDNADDLENVRFAMELRTWLLRSRDSFDRTPFIAVRVSDKRNSYLTSHLTLTGQDAGNSYYNRYDLFPFGILSQTYHYKSIIEDPVLNRIALQIHKFYYLDNNLDKRDEKKLKEALENCKRSAENDFYSYSYNADSSTSTAIGLCYRFFAAKCVLASKEDYLEFGSLKSQDLLNSFIAQLGNSNKEKLAKLEQTRWNSFMLIRGWLPANKNQVKNYEEQSSGVAHKHVLAKLHPFIAEWDNLDDSNLVEILDIFKLKANYYKKPQVTTMRSIEDTTRFFSVAEKTDEKFH